MANGDGGEYAHYIRDTKDGDAPKWRQVTRFEDGMKEAAISCDNATLFLRSVKDAPRGKVLRLSLDPSKTLKDAEVVVPESDGVIEGITPTASFLYVSDLIGGPSRIRRFDLDRKNVREVPLPEASGVAQLVPLEDDANDERIGKSHPRPPQRCLRPRHGHRPQRKDRPAGGCFCVFVRAIGDEGGGAPLKAVSSCRSAEMHGR